MYTVEQYKNAINESLQDNDKLLSLSEELVNSYVEAIEAIEAQKTESEKLKNKNDELRDECRKWINRAGIVSTPTQEDVHEETYEELTKRLKERMKGH